MDLFYFTLLKCATFPGRVEVPFRHSISGASRFLFSRKFSWFTEFLIVSFSINVLFCNCSRLLFHSSEENNFVSALLAYCRSFFQAAKNTCVFYLQA